MHDSPIRHDDDARRTTGSGDCESSGGDSGATLHAAERHHESNRSKVARASSGGTPDAAAIGIGTKVWLWVGSGYDRGDGWKEDEIASATPRKWVLRRYGVSIPKRDPRKAEWPATSMRQRCSARIVFTRAEYEAALEADSWTLNACAIGDAVRHCDDADKLRRVAEIIGFERPEAKR